MFCEDSWNNKENRLRKTISFGYDIYGSLNIQIYALELTTALNF